MSTALAPRSGQASASWQWFNYVAGGVPRGRRVLRINADETAICMFQGGGRGNVFLSKSEECQQHAPLSQRRTYITHVALICDDVSLQSLLPQYIIVGNRSVTAAEFAAAQAECPSNVVLVRQARAWNTGALMVRIVRRLRQCLESYWHAVAPVLLLDTARIHLTRAVFEACSSLGIAVVLVPPKLTWLLQPLDTDGFASFKHAVRCAHQAARIDAAGAGREIGVRCLIASICEGIRTVLNSRCWAAVFDRDGYGAAQALIGRRVRKHLEIDVDPVVAGARPSDAVLRHCFPARFKIPTALALQPEVVAGPRPAPPAALRRSLRLRGLPPPPPAEHDAAHGAAASGA